MIFDVTKHAVIARVNRKLALDRRVLQSTSSEKQRAALGDHFVIDDRQRLIARDVDVEAFARELGVLERHERMVEADGGHEGPEAA